MNTKRTLSSSTETETIESSTYYAYNTVSVNQGYDGYPSKISEAIVSDSVSNLREIQKIEGGEIVMLTRNFGKDLWSTTGTTIGNFTELSISYYDNVLYYDASKHSAEIVAHDYIFGELNITEFMAENFEGMDFYTVLDEIEHIKQVFIDIINNLFRKTKCAIWFDSEDRLSIRNILTDETVSFTDDSKEYMLALINTK